MIVTSPEDTAKFAELNDATPMFDVVANSPEIVSVLEVITVSIPSPPTIDNVSPSATSSVVALSSETENVELVNALLGKLVNVELLPSMFATNSPTVIVISPVASAVAVVVPKVNLSADSSHIKIALSPVEPLSIIKPESLAFEAAPEFNSNRVSSTVVFVVAKVVVVPLTVRFPVTVKSLPIVTSLGSPTVTVEPVAEVSISFDVPAMVKL